MSEEFEMEMGRDMEKYVKVAFDGIKELPSALEQWQIVEEFGGLLLR
jgi:hypothetical protein